MNKRTDHLIKLPKFYDWVNTVQPLGFYFVKNVKVRGIIQLEYGGSLHKVVRFEPNEKKKQGEINKFCRWLKC